MYNISSHYQLIFENLKKYSYHRRVLYLFPYGSTEVANIETIFDNITETGEVIEEAPMLIFYDQEPINLSYNYKLFNYIIQNFQPPFIFVTTEKDSQPVLDTCKQYNWPVVEYFHHIFAANDWYRQYRFDGRLHDISVRNITKKFITFNRITGNSRVYRSMFIAELSKHNLLNLGHVSYSRICPVHGHYSDNINYAIANKKIDKTYGLSILCELDKIDKDLRIDFVDSTEIQNDSMTLGPIDAYKESFLHVVTETCFWEKKKHLTEKIFKPIVAKQPFLLLGCAHNLSYLKEFGFKTFDKWWDESYDNIEDPVQRIDAVVKIISDICKLSNDSLKELLIAMEPVLEHNWKLFYSEEFITGAWNDLNEKLKNALAPLAPQI